MSAGRTNRFSNYGEKGKTHHQICMSNLKTITLAGLQGLVHLFNASLLENRNILIICIFI